MFNNLNPVELARTGYVAYGASTGGLNVRGEPMPEWEALPESVQAAWQLAATFIARNAVEQASGSDLEVIDVLGEVLGERRRQNEKWGQQNHNPAEWLAILGEEFGEVSKEVVEARFASDLSIRRERLQNLRTELVQTAAVATAIVESLDRNELAVAS